MPAFLISKTESWDLVSGEPQDRFFIWCLLISLVLLSPTLFCSEKWWIALLTCNFPIWSLVFRISFVIFPVPTRYYAGKICQNESSAEHLPGRLVHIYFLDPKAFSNFYFSSSHFLPFTIITQSLSLFHIYIYIESVSSSVMSDSFATP